MSFHHHSYRRQHNAQSTHKTQYAQINVAKLIY
uniref:Uncharacterized protein n=1 Tax=Arundo donax TaxID=35708 RepID=A0A0A8YHV5_ARUDO